MDLPYSPPQDQDFSQLLKTEDFTDENDLVTALKSLGHTVKIFGVYDDIFPLVNELKNARPDLVFNQFESFNEDRDMEPNIIALLELFGIPYTGAPAEALSLCKDKGLSKKLLSYHKIRIPEFITSQAATPIKTIPKSFNFPAICKPLGLEGSEGISQASLVHTADECLDRVKFVHDKLNSDCIVEEYIEGRELYVGVFGNDRLTVLPPRELVFDHYPDDMPKFATYKVKWDDKYREKWGIRSGKAKALPPKLTRNLKKMCMDIYRLFKLRGYARIDLRLSDAGELVFIEANPNPAMAIEDEFASAAKESGLTYPKLINEIIQLALTSSSSRLNRSA